MFRVRFYITESSEQQRPKRQRVAKTLWTEYYVCHRSRTQRIHANRTPGGQSGKVRPVQKRSKKVGCTARLNGICYVDSPDTVTFEYIGSHVNHVPRSIEDVQYLPNTEEVRKRIEGELLKGFSVRQVRQFMQREYADGELNQREAHITTVDVYNIYHRVIVQATRRDTNDFSSIRSWLGEPE